jgi:hypothetical protein
MAEVAILVGGSGGESAEMLKAGKVLITASFCDLLTFLRRSFDSGAAMMACRSPSRRRRDASTSSHGISGTPRPSESVRVS